MQNFMKTIINAVQFWTKKLIKDSTADWSQNDSTADNYVKNRTHWEETGIITLVDNLTSENYFNGNFPECTFIPGQKYNVVWNGTLYENLVCWNDGEFNVIASEDNGCPFYIDDDGGDGLYIDYASTFSIIKDTYIVSIYAIETVIHKIDEKYLPELTATPDWNQNDPEAKDYIKNRPFYEEVEMIAYVEEQTITMDSTEWTYPTKVDDIYPTYGQEFKVVLDGEEYTGKVWEDSDLCYRLDFTTNDGISVVVYDGVSMKANSADLDGEHTVAIYLSNSNVTPLDEKFIPDSIARKTQISNKMDKNSPVGTGSFSMNRKSGTTIGSYSHAEGYNGTASGYYAHAEGCYTTAQRKSQHVQGEYNILDTTGSTMTRGSYAHIVGNGTSASARSNAHTLDWNGNSWFAGDVYVGGTSQDNGAKLARVSEVPNNVFADCIVLNDISDGRKYKIQIQNGNIISTLAGTLDDFTYTTNSNGTTITGWKQTLHGEPSTEMLVPDGAIL